MCKLIVTWSNIADLWNYAGRWYQYSSIEAYSTSYSPWEHMISQQNHGSVREHGDDNFTSLLIWTSAWWLNEMLDKFLSTYIITWSSLIRGWNMKWLQRSRRWWWERNVAKKQVELIEQRHILSTLRDEKSSRGRHVDFELEQVREELVVLDNSLKIAK